MSADAVSALWRRLLLVIGRGRLTALDDSGAVQKVQVKLGADEIIDGVPRLAEYGFQSMPPAGSDAVLLFIAGERTNGVVVACGSQTYRMRGLADGEVAISDDKGQSVYLSAAGIRIDGGGLPIAISNATKVTVDAPAVEMTGNLTVLGYVYAETIGDIGGDFTMAGMRADYNVHKHGTSPFPVPLMS